MSMREDFSTARADKIYRSAKFRDIVGSIENAERDRIYCRHGMDHLLDVARIAMIINLARGYGFSADEIYACALLHDIGRAYSDSGHAGLGALKAVEILEECGFSEDEISVITAAIAAHSEEGEGLGGILHEADRLSRRCDRCKAADTCKWTELNEGIVW